MIEEHFDLSGPDQHGVNLTQISALLTATAPESALKPTQKFWTRLYDWLDRYAVRLLVAGMLFYIIVFSVASSYKYETYQTGYDQVYFEQPLWNTGEGRFMEQSDFAYSTSVFAVDWMPLLTLFTPFYWLLPSPHTLFFIETVILALGALPIYWLAGAKLDSRPAGLAFAAIYLLNPTLQYFNLLPFNLRAPALVALLYAFYFFEHRRWWPFALFALLAIATRTEVSLVVAMFGVYGLLNRRATPARFWLPPLVLAPLYFVIIFSLILPAFITPGTMVVPPAVQPVQISAQQREYISNTDTIISTTYGDLGKNLPEVLKNTITNPIKTLQRVFTVSKISYVLQMLLPLAFLSLLSPRVMLFALPIVAINLLSIRPTQYDYRSHYSALLIFPVVVGAIYGSAKLLLWLQSQPARRGWHVGQLKLASLGAIMLLLGVFMVATQLIERNPLPGVLLNAEKKAMIEPANALISRIPRQASVAATSFFGPHLLPRRYLYPFPLALYSPPPQAVQYILIDTNAQALYLAENGRALDDKRPVDWLRQDPDYLVVDRVAVTGQKDRQGMPREIQLWQRQTPGVPPYIK